MEPTAHLGEERLLVRERGLGQQVARDEDEAGALGFHGGDQVVPLRNPLVEVAGDDELHRLGRFAGLGAARTTKGYACKPVSVVGMLV